MGEMDGMEHSEVVNSALLAALEQVWEAIRARHGEVPPALLTLGQGTERGHPGQVRMGHFAAERWAHGDSAANLHEVFVGGEGLAMGAGEVLATLLHEAAHALGHARGVKDTSRQGRYHNALYASLARELGLEVAVTGAIGWSDTSVPAATAAIYGDELAQLEGAIRAWRRVEWSGRRVSPGPQPDSGESGEENGAGGEDGETPVRGTVACLCRCGRRVRVTRSVLALGPIVCGVCNDAFTPAS